MGRRNRRGRARKELPSTDIDRASITIIPLRDWDSDEWDAYGIAVSCVLEALEGLWFDADDPKVEREINDHISQIKEKIQKAI